MIHKLKMYFPLNVMPKQTSMSQILLLLLLRPIILYLLYMQIIWMQWDYSHTQMHVESES